MPNFEDREHRKALAAKTRSMVVQQLEIEDQDETSVMAAYRGYYLQISFSEIHPMMLICLARVLRRKNSPIIYRQINKLNLHCVLGAHALNEEVGCYSFRASHWLDTELSPQRFHEILARCADEADRGYAKLRTSHH